MSIDLNYVDIYNNPVKYPKSKYSNYDEFVIWKGVWDEDSDNKISIVDILRKDFDKYNELCLKVWGINKEGFGHRKPKDIEKFLSLYLGKRILLTMVLENYNVDFTRMPNWIFYYRDAGNVRNFRR